MMQFRRIGILFVAIVLTYSAAKSDVPPAPGYVRQSASLILESGEDLSAYRFFIDSPMRIEEIKIEKGERTVVDSAERAGAARFGTLLAVPKKSFAKFGDELLSWPSDEFKKLLADKGIDGVIKVLSHNFQTTIRDGERSGWKDPVYRIDKDRELGLKAVHISGGATKSKTGTGFGIYSREVKTGLFWVTVIGGALMTLAFISLGVWSIRRSKRRVRRV